MSIIFELSYWKDNACPHNFDVMHIEKNNFDWDIIRHTWEDKRSCKGPVKKKKNHAKARLDLLYLGIKDDLQPKLINGRKQVLLPKACYSLSSKEKETFCRVIDGAKLLYGCSSNIARCVNVKARKVAGYKSHDAHIMLHYLLQVAARKTLPKRVALPLIKLGDFFRKVNCKVVKPKDLDNLLSEITIILCELEKNFLLCFLRYYGTFPYTLSETN